MRTHPSEIQTFIAMLDDPDPVVRVQGINGLCPCRVKRNYAWVWDRLIPMANDEDRKVRSHIFHVLADGSPREREPEIVLAIESLRNDPDRKLRRRVRGVLAHYRRTGDINIL